MHIQRTIALYCVAMMFGALCVYAQTLPTAAQEAKQQEMRRQQQQYFESMLEEKVHSHRRDAAQLRGREALRKSAGGAQEVVVSGDPNTESEIHAAVNPADSNNIVVVPIKTTADAGISLPVYYTKNFGETWNVSTNAPTLSSGGDPIVAFADDGTLHFSWLDFQFRDDTHASIFLLWARSLDGGVTWSEADTLDYGDLEYPSFKGKMIDKQWMAVDCAPTSAYRGTLYIVYVEMKSSGIGGFSNIVLRKVRPGAAPDAVSLSITGDAFGGMQFPSVGVDDKGDVHVFFYAAKPPYTTMWDFWLWHAVSTDGGVTFSAPTKIAPLRFPANQQTAPTYLPQRLHPSPQFAVDGFPTSPRKGSMYAVWTSNDLSLMTREPSVDEPLHVYFCRSSDYGVTWSAPVRLNTDNPSHRSDHFHPSVEVSPSGTVIATWFDGREANNNTQTHFYTAFSYDGGLTFTDNLQVSSQPSNIDESVQGSFGVGDYNKTVSTKWYAIPIWPDGRANDGNLDVYAAFIPLNNTVGIERISPVTDQFALVGIHPNPASSHSDVQFRLRSESSVEGILYNALGREVRRIAPATFGPGTHSLTVDLGGVAEGAYYFYVKTKFGTAWRNLVVASGR